MIRKMKTIRNLFKQDKEKFTPPKSVQDCIPVQTIYKDGIFQVSKNKYSKCFRFTDINYAVASRILQILVASTSATM